MKRLLFAFIAILIYTQAYSNKDENFRGRLYQAKEMLRNSQLITAYPYFMELYGNQPDNANVNYSLGVCYTLEHVVSRKSIFHLEKAVQDIALDYEVNPTRENQAPVYAYYYLIMAYTQNGECEKANETLKVFKQVYGKEDLFTMDAEWLVENCDPKDKLIKEQDFPIDPAYTALKNKSENSDENQEELAIQNTPKVKPKTEPTTERKKPTKPTTFKNVYKTKVTTNRYKSKADADANNNKLQDSLKLMAKIEEDLERRFEEQNKDVVVTKPIEYTNKMPLYGVQVGAFKTLIPTRTFKGLKNVETYMDFHGIIRYAIGGFSSKTYAERLLKIVQSKGYDNAFIVDLNKKSRYGSTVVSKNGISVKKYAWKGKPNQKLEYSVQVGAFKDLNNTKLELLYLELENIKEINMGEVTLLTVGSFKSYSDAQGYLHQVKEIGISDAFIVAFNSTGSRVPVEK